MQHYMTYGWREGRDPSAFFDTSAYLAINPDAAGADANPLQHYLAHGVREGRPGAIDALSPLRGHQPLPSVQFAVGRIIRGGFDEDFDLWRNPDVAQSGADPWQHYHTYGWREGRNPDILFDPSSYLALYPDVAAAGVDPLEHYTIFRWKEGRSTRGAAVGFGASAYLAANPDVAVAGVNPLDHYLVYGIREHRVFPGLPDGLY